MLPLAWWLVNTFTRLRINWAFGNHIKIPGKQSLFLCSRLQLLSLKKKCSKYQWHYEMIQSNQIIGSGFRKTAFKMFGIRKSWCTKLQYCLVAVVFCNILNGSGFFTDPWPPSVMGDLDIFVPGAQDLRARLLFAIELETRWKGKINKEGSNSVRSYCYNSKAGPGRSLYSYFSCDSIKHFFISA